MIRAAMAAIVLLVSTGNGDKQPRPRPVGRMTIIQQQIIIRIGPAPGVRPMAGPRRQSTAWQESRGPRCLLTRNIVHADQFTQESIDLVLRDGMRVRARLERRCPAMDYYSGFYVTPNADGQICAERDQIRTRSGSTCGIDRFRLLRDR